MTAVADTPAAVLHPTRCRAGAGLPLLAAIACLLGVAVFFRVWQLASVPGVNGDEAWSGVQATRLVHGEPIAWRTPSGNPVNVFFLLPLAALQAMFSPSFALLRSVAVISGLAAIAVNWWLCRRAYDTRTAVVSTLLVALLPINIAYSRFAWDSSQTLLFTLLVMYLPLIWIRRWPGSRGWLVGAAVAFAAAAVVHPTNIFTAPLVAVPIVYARRRWLLARLRGTVTSDRPIVLVGIVLASALLTYSGWTLVSHFAARIPQPGQLWDFLGLYLRLLSGATTYEYITAAASAGGLPGSIPQFVNLLMLLLATLAFAGWFQRLSHDDDDVDVCLVAGWLLVTLGFAFVAGPQSLAPHLERYGICLVAPAVLVLARGLGWWIEPARSNHRFARLALLSVAYCFLVSFALAYFHVSHVTGGLSHRAFRTAAVEPKQAALERIVAQRATGAGTEIIAPEWWLYWPLAYLAYGEDRVRVRGLDGPWDARALTRQDPHAADTDTWHVEFANTWAEALLVYRLQQQGNFQSREFIPDYAGTPLISLIRVGSAGEKKISDRQFDKR